MHQARTDNNKQKIIYRMRKKEAEKNISQKD